MDMYRLFCRDHHHEQQDKCFLFHVQRGEDIMGCLWHELWSLKCAVARRKGLPEPSVEEVQARYTIRALYPVLCEGCRYQADGQRHHMQCPWGCLHCKEDCVLCGTALQTPSPPPRWE